MRQILVVVAIILCQISFTQSLKEGNTIWMFSPNYSFAYGIGSHADAYGMSSRAGMNLGLKLAQGYTVSVEGAFLFGATVKDLTMLGSIATESGFVVGKSQGIEYPALEGRGGHFMAEVGKIFPILEKNKNSGIHVKTGFGYFFYRAISTVDFNLVPQLKGDYMSGYDRAMGGLAWSQFIGYTYFGKLKFLNFSIGVENMLAFTSSKRSVNFATGNDVSGLSETKVLIGPKLYFTIPLYIRDQKYTEEMFYTY